MEDIKSVIETIREKIKNNKNVYEKNEEAVKLQVINPLLRSLNWDPEDPETVKPEEQISQYYADYSLYKGKKRVIIIEIKNLSINIDLSKQIERNESFQQVIDYCINVGSPYGILTNGIIWIFFRSFQEGTNIKERIIWRINIENDDINEIIRKLEIIKKENIENIEENIKNLKKLENLERVWDIFIKDKLINYFATTFKEYFPNYESNLNEIKEFLNKKIELTKYIQTTEQQLKTIEDTITFNDIPKLPFRIKIEKDEYYIKHYREILVQVAEWLIKQGKLKSPTDSGPKLYLINKEPIHKNKEKFRSSHKLSNGLYIELNLDAKRCIEMSYRILEINGYSRDKLKIIPI
jgi:predicted type IV restriction endonuclease